MEHAHKDTSSEAPFSVELQDPPTETKEAEDVVVDDTLLRGKKLALLFSAFMLAFSLVALDQTIISTALPTIASHFNAVSNLSWIASGYFLPQAAFMLFYGRILTITPAKPVFLISIAIFELGSLFCAVAPSVNFLIFGRVVAGLGGGGLWVSITSIIAQVTTITQRPVLLGLFGAVFACASVVGPILGGVLSDRATWRWCFYINLPIGAVAVVGVFFILPNNPPPPSQDASDAGRSSRDKWIHLDWIGAFLNLVTVTLLLLALQWGGNTRPWNDPVVITLLVLFAVFLGLFVYWESIQGDRAVLPLKLFARRNVLGPCVQGVFIFVGFIIANFYLPFLYQVRGHSATRSGLDVLPFMAAGVSTTVVTGGLISVTGRPWPILFVFPMLAAVASGLLYTVNLQTSSEKLAGFQILLGIGLGACTQNAVVVSQAAVSDNQKLVPQVTSLVTFMQLIGNSVGIAGAGAVFASQLRSQLRVFAPDLPEDILHAVTSSVSVIHFLPEEIKTSVVNAYIAALNRVFLIGVPGAGLAMLSAFIMTRGKLDTKAAAAAI